MLPDHESGLRRLVADSEGLGLESAIRDVFEGRRAHLGKAKRSA
jgi:hypothetical protein